MPMMPPTADRSMDEKEMSAASPQRAGMSEPTVEPTPMPIQMMVLRDIKLKMDD